ncbi:hypothetical protein [Flavobacterium frigoris]|uniref:hypothetical protein n=1 Tax=Flavobacterium frigoris TaxID=229204 RepID=UPI0039E80558
MKFDCKEISIDDEEFGCAITFSENIDLGEYEEKLTIDEIINSIGTYVMLQRTYAEDELEEDYYYFESSESEQSCEIKDFEINLFRNQFVLTFEKEMYEIQLHLDNQIFEKLKIVLKKIAYKKGKINFKD